MTLLTTLADFFPDELLAQPGSTDGFGEWTASGSALNIPCYISGKVRLVRNASGNEVVSSVKVTCAEVNTLTTTGFRYTLPSRYTPNADIEAISTKPVSDEGGAHHEVLFLP